MIPSDQIPNYDTFRDCLSEAVVQRLTSAPVKKPGAQRRAKGRRNGGTGKEKGKKEAQESSGSNRQHEDLGDAAELADFIDYLASEMFLSLSEDLRTLSYAAVQNDASLSELYTDPLPPSTIDALLAPLPASVADSLTAYGIVSPSDSLDEIHKLVTMVFETYISTATATPPEYAPAYLMRGKAEACELCGRDWIPLTYHHLIPRQVHEKAIRRGWCAEWEVNKVAWLCRACHSFVHRVASNEELARELNDVELLREREDVRRFVKWVGGVRWKSR